MVITHKKFLAAQWKNQIKRFTGLDAGTIAGKTIDVENKEFVVAFHVNKIVAAFLVKRIVAALHKKEFPADFLDKKRFVTSFLHKNKVDTNKTGSCCIQKSIPQNNHSVKTNVNSKRYTYYCQITKYLLISD